LTQFLAPNPRRMNEAHRSSCPADLLLAPVVFHS
jgi:hypothetical protein